MDQGIKRGTRHPQGLGIALSALGMSRPSYLVNPSRLSQLVSLSRRAPPVIVVHHHHPSFVIVTPCAPSPSRLRRVATPSPSFLRSGAESSPSRRSTSCATQQPSHRKRLCAAAQQHHLSRHWQRHRRSGYSSLIRVIVVMGRSLRAALLRVTTAALAAG